MAVTAAATNPHVLPGGLPELPVHAGVPHQAIAQSVALHAHELPPDMQLVHHGTTEHLVPVPEDDMDYDDMPPPFTAFGQQIALPPMPATPMSMPTPSSPTPTARSTSAEVFSTPPSGPAERECAHKRTTKQGSNAHALREKCLDCGKLLKSEAREAAASMEMRDRKECPHVRKDFRGTTGTSWKWTCKDCGESRTGHKQPGQTGEAAWRAYNVSTPPSLPCASSSGYTPSPASPHATDKPGRVIELMQIAIGVQYDLTNNNPIGAEQLDVIYNKCRNRVYGIGFVPTASMSRSGAASHRFSPATMTPALQDQPLHRHRPHRRHQGFLWQAVLPMWHERSRPKSWNNGKMRHSRVARTVESDLELSEALTDATVPSSSRSTRLVDLENQA